jgi:hypothetical protein
MAISSRTVNNTRPHHVDGSRGTMWREKMIHPRMYQLDRTSTREQRTPGDGAHVQSIVKQCARATRCTVSIIPYTRSFPCTPILRRSRISGCKKIAPAADISSSKYYTRYVPEPTCRGSVPLYMPPLAIKGEACNVTTQAL